MLRSLLLAIVLSTGVIDSHGGRAYVSATVDFATGSQIDAWVDCNFTDQPCLLNPPEALDQPMLAGQRLYFDRREFRGNQQYEHYTLWIPPGTVVYEEIQFDGRRIGWHQHYNIEVQSSFKP